MATHEQRRIIQAVKAGMELALIEEQIIEPAPVEDDEKAALWLYAQVLGERARPTRAPALVGG